MTFTNLPVDPILFVGGMLFVWLAWLGFTDAPRLHRVYRMDRNLRENEPEPPKDWNQRARRHATIYAILGGAVLVLSWVLAGGIG